jgi:hypothetical protein
MVCRAPIARKDFAIEAVMRLMAKRPHSAVTVTDLQKAAKTEVRW